ncbi:hypothetical protein CBOM_07918 [Ceraceosorus bombacis]|uniref:Uncharacterized protein n=1 Tax=Ceraceosorus bombacis TaxID=401625 RepID=A0A0N7L927_9BASI|nr:hypothetical protein CBOM_07918 [Ceraceosorus bombacis]
MSLSSSVEKSPLFFPHLFMILYEDLAISSQGSDRSLYMQREYHFDFFRRSVRRRARNANRVTG